MLFDIVFQLINVNPESWQADELASLITDERTYPVSHTDIGEQRRVTPRVRALVVHSPAYVRADQRCEKLLFVFLY